MSAEVHITSEIIDWASGIADEEGTDRALIWKELMRGWKVVDPSFDLVQEAARDLDIPQGYFLLRRPPKTDKGEIMTHEDLVRVHAENCTSDGEDGEEEVTEKPAPSSHNHAYADELDIPEGWQMCIPEEKGRLNIRQRAQVEIYGFSDIEIYDFDVTFAIYLYERLRMYQDSAGIIDMTQHKFVIPVLDDPETGACAEKECTQGEALNLMLEYLRRGIRLYVGITNEPRGFHYVQTAMRIFAETFSVFWW